MCVCEYVQGSVHVGVAPQVRVRQCACGRGTSGTCVCECVPGSVKVGGRGRPFFQTSTNVGQPWT